MTLNDSLVSCSDYDEVKARYVKITFWKVANVDMFIKNHALLIEYLESISKYKINERILSVEELGFNMIQVKIKCPYITEANFFLKNLELVARELNIKVALDKPSIACRVNDYLEEIQTLYSEMSKKVNEQLYNYNKLLNDLDNDTYIMSIDQFEKKKIIKLTYDEKIKEIYNHKSEFEKSQNYVQKSLMWFRDHSIYSEEEIKKLVNYFKREIFRCETALPIYAHKSEIVRTIMNNQVTILIGETGSGKTTQIAQYLYEAWPRSEKIIACTQPRKVAAVSVADRVAQEMRCSIGDIVGYQVGMSKKTSGNTRILFMTDHILLNECLTDNTFSKYSCIILDEAHERSIFTDLLLGFIKKAIKVREDLKVVITSATIDPSVFQKYFKNYNPPELRVSGRVFPVDVFYEPPIDLKDHVRSACNLALNLHNNQDIPGDILVFLTSPIETEQAVKIMKGKHATNTQICQLHGRLQIQEQKEVLKETKIGIRKIVFATNAAETSVTLPGIKYVIDTGLVREVTFDGSKNMSSLVLTKVTKSSADQRKGRAGRTEPGKCYRLFTEQEYNEMKPTSVPEILRVHLGQSLLKLMMLGVNDPKEFDFVEAPTVEAMNSALEMLEELKAIDDHGITDLGRKLAVISLEPRLGKVVLMGVEQRLGFECVIISALNSTGSQIFYRGGTNENKLNSDKKRALYCDDCGDMATLLNVYKEWVKIPENQRSKWCGNNYINSKKMNGTKDLIRETLHCLRNELRLCISEVFSDEPDVNLKLSKIIFDCYYTNLVRYTGHRQIGFRLVKKPELRLQIHPSSSLTYMEHYPNWIVYESILTTSETFMLNTTFIKQSWVDEKIQQGILKYTQDELEKVVLDCVKLGNVGSYIHSIISPTESKLPNAVANVKRKNFIEEQIYQVYPNILAVVDIETKPFICLYALMYQFRYSHQKALSELNELKLNLYNETVTAPIKVSSNIKGILGNGAIIETLLMPNECSQILISTSPSNLNTVQSYMRQIKGVSKIFMKDSKTEFIVTFSDSESCSKALRLNPKTICAKFIKFTPFNENNFLQSLSCITVKVMRTRRPIKGFGFIELKSIRHCETFISSNSCLNLSHNNNIYQISVQKNKKNPMQIFLRNLPAWVCESKIYQAPELIHTGIVSRVTIPRQPFPSEKESENQYEIFTSDLSTLASSEQINILPPKNNDFHLIAYIKVNSMTEADELIDKIKNHFGTVTNNYTEGRLELKIKYFTPQNIYNKIKHQIDPILERTKMELNESLNHDVKQGANTRKDVMTTIEATTLFGLGRIKSQLDTLLSGLQWFTTNYRTFRSRFQRQINNLANNNSTYVYYDDRKQCLVIYGLAENINRTKSEINTLFDGEVSDMKREIDLRNSQYAKGLMKNLIRRFGCDLSNLLIETGANDLDINLKKHQLIFWGTQEAFEKLESVLKEVSTAIETSRVNNGQENVNNDYFNIHREGEELGECPICLDSVSFNDYYVIEYCGHIYCKDCITNLIKNNCQQSNFPMKCVKENCNEELVLKDFQSLLSKEDDFQSMVEAAVKYFQSQNSDKYSYCPTPDCPSIFRKLPKPSSPLELKEFICSECQSSTCTSCGGNYHVGMSCSTYSKYFNSVDENLKKWLKEDSRLRSICDKCGSGIEKNGGCNHIECTHCKAHICWVCKALFEKSPDCYQHMRDVHKTIHD